MNPGLEKSLHCRYVTRGFPYLLLQPAKEEEAYLNPRIVIYHDVMSDKEIDMIKTLATPRVSRLRRPIQVLVITWTAIFSSLNGLPCKTTRQAN